MKKLLFIALLIAFGCTTDESLTPKDRTGQSLSKSGDGVITPLTCLCTGTYKFIYWSRSHTNSPDLSPAQYHYDIYTDLSTQIAGCPGMGFVPGNLRFTVKNTGTTSLQYKVNGGTAVTILAGAQAWFPIPIPSCAAYTTHIPFDLTIIPVCPQGDPNAILAWGMTWSATGGHQGNQTVLTGAHLPYVASGVCL